MLTYEAFWSQLSQHYPVSKGAIRLPIASALLSIDNFDHEQLLDDARQLLEQLLATHGNVADAKQRATHAGEEKIIDLIDADYTGIVRFDCIVDAKTKQPKIVEVNCDYPDGLLLHDKTFSVLTGQPNTCHRDLFLTLFETDSIYILHPKGAPFFDAYQTEADTLNQYTNARLGDSLSDAKHFSTTRRCVEVSKLLTSGADLTVLNGKKIINSFALRTLGYKDLLSDISHPLIPRTLELTSIHMAEALSSPERWVLKPLNGCEGVNVFFGSDFSPVEWQRLIEKCCNQAYVIQERVETDTLTVPLYDKEMVVEKSLYYDICPHFFVKAGKVIGTGHTLMRFSQNKVVNVSQGGGIGYYAS